MSESNDQYYFNFAFFKVDPKWRWMADLAKEESAKEVENVINNSGIMFRCYSNLGLRDDTDFLFWFAAKTVEEIQTIIEKNIQNSIWKIHCPIYDIFVVYTTITIRTRTKAHGFVTGNEPKKHVVVYPFTKTREWYLLPKEKRQEIMDEHIEVSKKYPQVVLNTTYSFEYTMRTLCWHLR